MSSWFSSESLQSLKANATSLAGNAAELAGKVVHDSGILQNSEMMQKLTLTTPELSAERARIDAEERRKEMVHDKLAGMLPWETRDAERDILVDECKEAILKLSSDASTFTGPWQMPEKGVNLNTKMKKKKKPSDDEVQDGEENEEDEEDDTLETTPASSPTAGGGQQQPSAASLERLAKLQPLPPLLQDFDLDMHVGLIQRLLQEDEALVRMQSTLSGGGAREKVFWHNYFFHCAFTRYEAGLSIDEIWSEDNQPQPPAAAAAADGGTAAVDGTGATFTTTQDADHDEEHTITFDDTDDVVGTDSASATTNAAPAKKGEQAGMDPTTTATTADSGGGAGEKDNNSTLSDTIGFKADSSEYEIVGNADGSDATNNNNDNNEMGGDADDDVDYELDELEEEIARELED